MNTPPKPTPARLGHIHLKVRRAAHSADFYQTLLDWSVSECVGDRYIFLTGGTTHHDLALQAIGPRAADAPPDGVGLYHVAFEFPDAKTWRAALDRADDLGASYTSVDHGISHAAYLQDPDGNGVELYLDRRHLPGGSPRWNGRSLPLTPSLKA